MRRTLVRLLVASCIVALAGIAAASIPPTPLNKILTTTAAGPELRDHLRAFAAERPPAEHEVAGEAWLRIGQSFELDGAPDSAIVAFRRAVELRADPEDHLALATALLRRQQPGDAGEALRDLSPLGGTAADQLPAIAARLRGTLGWAALETGRADSAALWFGAASEALNDDPEWRLRLGRAAIGTGNRQLAWRLIRPVVVRTRGRAAVATDLLVAAGFRPDVATEIAARDQLEKDELAAWGAQRVEFRGADGAPLAGALLPGRPGARAVIVISAPGDTLASHDSLAIGLRRSGRAVLVLEPRGSGGSVSDAWPWPASWSGHEDRLARLTAADLHAAARVLARTAHADTSRLVLGGVGRSAALAIRVASRSPRVSALLLVSPTPGPVEWAPLRAAIAAHPLPTFYQLALEEHWSTWDESDALFQVGNQGASRVVESRGGGKGAAQFRGDPELMPRLVRWLDGLPAGKAPASAPRPARPRSR